jgi:tight adherence protein B
MMGIPPGALLLGALACLLLALGLWMLTRAQGREQEQSLRRHLQRSLDAQRQAPHKPLPTGLADVMPALASAAPATRHHALLRWLELRLGISAWGLEPRTLVLLAAGGPLLGLLAAMAGDLALGLTVCVLYALLCALGIWHRLGKRRQRLLQQLPGFLDNMVRLISIGNSPHAAFQLAVGNVQAPLGDALQQAAATLSASPDLGQALGQLERSWRLPEFGLLAAVFRMSTRYGGRADLVLERVSTYIRDRQSAERELRALSAEIRLSAWVLALLPIVVGSLIMVLNKGYFMRMWNDASGQTMILVAAGLEAFGAFLLYRLARLK